ncbi:MAG: molecular chaperone GrpE [Plectolyngbya sp. WJT66-NPBG17]|jgi:molecular chaperone GrpE (heat shock protein)|nr:molecular chaperone GrpE [Plectolyngbya sp. WJT66-NPBG17]MBW4524137.1 XRE family transcriptional regulator [Phormidium tanganyikae FI6-MK23]
MDLGVIGLSLGLVGLGSFYWRSHKAAQATEAILRSEIDALKQTQTNLEQKLESAIADWQTSQREKAALEIQIEEFKQQCARLRSQLETQSTQTQQDSEIKAFEQIQSLLTQYPSVRRMTETKPDLPARNLIGMFTALDNLIKFWDYQAIGKPWEQVEFDPQLHQGDVADLAPGEAVFVRFIGYRNDDRILIPAKVSRTLPAGATS